MKIRYKHVLEAREVLNLPERASLDEIKSSYRMLVNQWHPDKCNEMTKRIIAAYKTVIAYCNQYKYSFAEDEIKKYMHDDEWLFDRFGNDPLWGNNDS